MWGNTWNKDLRQGYQLWKDCSGIQGSSVVVQIEKSECFQKYFLLNGQIVILVGQTRMYPRA